MSKETTQKEWPTIVAGVLSRLKSYEGGIGRFFESFHRSQQVVSTWRTGKIKASEEDRIKFLEHAGKVLKELEVEKAQARKREADLLKEVLSM